MALPPYVSQNTLFDEDGTEQNEETFANTNTTPGDIPAWPSPARLPHNRSKKEGGIQQTVGQVLDDDLRRAHNVLIVTGFSSIPRLVSFLSQCRRSTDHKESVRILIGWDLQHGRRKPVRVGEDAIEEEIRGYWLTQRLSIFQTLEVVDAVQMLEQDCVEIRTSQSEHRRVHAKIYKTNEAVMLGSSNFSKYGLEHQIEANSRFIRSDKKRADYFNDACGFAEQIWATGQNYKDQLVKLLNELLREVDWKEALARGCAELLEGEWAKRYFDFNFGERPLLYPFQWQGIAQALTIIENMGGVLVADATGSGKTWLGAALLKGMMNKMWNNPARIENTTPVLICPPKVRQHWKSISGKFGLTANVFSHGAMSNTHAEEYKGLTKAISRAQVVAVDEAHNFLRRGSNRSRLLMRNLADHVVLFTATPINREMGDIFSVLMMIGPDNFDKEVADLLEKAFRLRGLRYDQYFSDDEQHLLREAVRRFTVRRTKPMLNRMVDDEPEAYKRDGTRSFRFPKPKSQTYKCDGTANDRQLALDIFETARKLKGLLRLGKLHKPPYMSLTDDQYLSQRLKGAQGLALYMVMDCLRSSRAALLEHIYGTMEALQLIDLDISIKPKETGAVIEKLKQAAGRIPKNTLADAVLPTWLSDPNAHRAASQEEIWRYSRIGELTKQLTTRREETKAQTVAARLDTHDCVIAFDRHLITLHHLETLLTATRDCRIIVATGEQASAAKQLQAALHPNEEGEAAPQAKGVRLIGLCSDAMSEGINLQKAAAVVNLDMPTVVLRIEQRVGRIERMDSAHDVIEVWWPKDSLEFAPRHDDKFFERHTLVSKVLGANVEVPPELYADSPRAAQTINPKEIIKEWRAAGKELDDTARDDAFAPIRHLVSGKDSLIDEGVYPKIRRQPERIRTSVSSIRSDAAWCFLAIEGRNGGAPRLIYLDSLDALPATKLDEVAGKLRAQLGGGATRRPLDKIAKEYINRFVRRVEETEPLLLQNRKRIAIEEMRLVLEEHLAQLSATYRIRKRASPNTEFPFEKREDVDETLRARENLTKSLLEHLEPRHTTSVEDDSWVVDLNTLAERWLDLIRPIRDEYIQKLHSKRKLVRLSDIRRTLSEKPFNIGELQKLLREESLWIPPLHTHIVAAIVGVPDVK